MHLRFQRLLQSVRQDLIIITTTHHGIFRKRFLKASASCKRTWTAGNHTQQGGKKDTLEILGDSGINRGVLHCFSGDMDMAEKAMEMGFYISIAGPVTFKNASKLRETAEAIPDDYLLIETDAPYLTPEPFRGRRNEPAF